MMGICITVLIANFKADIGKRFPELLADIDGSLPRLDAINIVAERAGFRAIEGGEQVGGTLKELTAHIEANYRRQD